MLKETDGYYSDRKLATSRNERDHLAIPTSPHHFFSSSQNYSFELGKMLLQSQASSRRACTHQTQTRTQCRQGFLCRHRGRRSSHQQLGWQLVLENPQEPR
jgi:hypothetical protein